VFTCCNNAEPGKKGITYQDTIDVFVPDTNRIPDDKFGEQVRYGRDLMLRTAYYIGPDGISGKYLGNKMNCTNCHQAAGTKPYAFNLLRSHEQYPQYRAREAKVLSLSERVNNCVTRPHNGKPLPLDSKEMIAFLSYLKWINRELPPSKFMKGEKNLKVTFPDRAADPERGKILFGQRCQRCHGPEGEGVMDMNGITYTYPPLWGKHGYQPGSSMHRVIKQAQWIKANMPYDSARWNNVLLNDTDALDIAAFVNDDRIHPRPDPKHLDYPFPEEKAIDYAHSPFIDPFSETQHKFGPYQPIIDYWKNKGMKPTY
jgi:thiosulfate dehydrogenase